MQVVCAAENPLASSSGDCRCTKHPSLQTHLILVARESLSKNHARSFQPSARWPRLGLFNTTERFSFVIISFCCFQQTIFHDLRHLALVKFLYSDHLSECPKMVPKTILWKFQRRCRFGRKLGIGNEERESQGPTKEKWS